MISLSQDNCFQDVFADFINQNKTDGYVVDIGCRGKLHNNSILLLNKGWKGVGADVEDFSEEWKDYSGYFHNMDVTIKKNVDFLFSDVPEIVDFLSLDVDSWSVACLKNIDFDKFKFRCICIEHDFYINGESLRTPQRDYLTNRGYVRVIETMGEDWWINPNLVDSEVKKILNNIPPHKELNGDEMYLILEWLKIK